MSIHIKILEPTDIQNWDAFVGAHSQANLYHLTGWENVIKKTYSHKTYYLMGMREKENNAQVSRTSEEILDRRYKADSSQVAGILPLVHLKHFVLGSSLVSIPFFDIGGILAEDEETEKALTADAIKLAEELGVKNIELRNNYPNSWLNLSSKLKTQSATENNCRVELSYVNWVLQTRSHKVRMILELPESSATLMKSFRSKLRSQIKKPISV